MRLIDANALADKIKRWNKRLKPGFYRSDIIVRDALECVQEYISDAPTLDYEPVKHGTWEWYEEPYDSRNPDGDYGWRCSCCKQDLAAELTLGIPGMHYAYDVLDDPDNPPTIKRCLFCGAKMKEDVKKYG